MQLVGRAGQVGELKHLTRLTWLLGVKWVDPLGRAYFVISNFM